MTMSNRVRFAVMFDLDRTAATRLTVHRLLKQRTERIFPDNANNYWLVGRHERRFRPVNKAAEIVEENRFERVLAFGFGLLRLGKCERGRERSEQNTGRGNYR